MKIAAVALVPFLAAAPALAQDAPPIDPGAQTAHADTLVVVTPNPPVIVTTNGAGAGAGPSAIAPAKAATDGADAAGPAPHNEDWSNVSHINGHPVPVGSRGDYLYKQKMTNISINPFGPLMGYWDGSIARAVGKNLAVNVTVAAWDLLYKGESTGFQAAVSLPIYFRRPFSGPFLEPGIVFRSNNDGNSCYYNGGSCSTGTSWVGPEILFGWHWSFDSGLNISWAFGVAKHLADNTMSSNSDPDFNGYFRVGYAF